MKMATETQVIAATIIGTGLIRDMKWFEKRSRMCFIDPGFSDPKRALFSVKRNLDLLVFCLSDVRTGDKDFDATRSRVILARKLFSADLLYRTGIIEAYMVASVARANAQKGA